MARKQMPRGPQLDIAGDLAIAFVNTAAARKENRQQGVANYSELLTWAQQVGVLQAHDAHRLAQRAAEDSAAASAVWNRVVQARVALAQLFYNLQLERTLPAEDLEIFNQALGQSLTSVRLVPGDPGLTWGWAGDADALDRMVWPVHFAAAQLLISTQGLPHVRQCSYKGCRLFFLDRSPTQQRRWCSMKACGNRFKSLAYYRQTGKALRQRQHHYEWRTRRPRESKLRNTLGLDPPVS